jgi:hypothetical protein
MDLFIFLISERGSQMGVFISFILIIFHFRKNLY